MDFRKRLKYLRENKEMTYSQLAAVLSKSEGAVRSWEMGRSSPDLDTLLQLAQYFGCTTDYLLGLSDYKTHDERVFVDQVSDEIVEKTEKLPLEILVSYQGIQQYILDSYDYLVAVNKKIADEYIRLMVTIVKSLFYHVELIFELDNAGCDSFDEDDAPFFINEIDKKIGEDIELLQHDIRRLLHILRSKMVEVFPEYQEKGSYIKVWRAKIEAPKHTPETTKEE